MAEKQSNMAEEGGVVILAQDSALLGLGDVDSVPL